MKSSAFAGWLLVMAATMCAAKSRVAVYDYQEGAASGWHGVKSAVLLPVQNESNVGEAALAVKTNAIMRQAMMRSGRFELVAIHTFNPAIRRALNDKLLDQAAVTSAEQDAKLDTVLPVAAAVGVDFVVEISVQAYKDATETTPLEITLHGALYDAATGEARPTPAEGPIWGCSLSSPLKTDAKNLETEALSVACDNVIRVFSGRPLPPKPEPRLAKAPAAEPAAEPATEVAAVPVPTPAAEPAEEPAKPKVPLGRDVQLPMSWLYYLLTVFGVAGF